MTLPRPTNRPHTQTAYFAGGCFWCTEAVFSSLKGVIAVTPGYTGGHLPDPSYTAVSRGNTGHTETVKIDFNPSLISYSTLLDIFFTFHDPTTPNQQDADIGPQYRSAIFYSTPQELQAIKHKVNQLNKNHVFTSPIVTQVESFVIFYPAETYHREYFKHHQDAPYCQVVINPKIQKLRAHYAKLLV
jgi:peptide-methionine (S)-S-oxide reductase